MNFVKQLLTLALILSCATPANASFFIPDGAVTAAKLASSSVTTVKLDDSFISGLTTVTPLGEDFVAIADTSDSNKKKKAAVSALRNAVYRSVTTTDPVGVDDETMKLSGASFTSTLPTAVGAQGKRYRFIHAGTSLTQVYTIATTASQTVGGLATTVWKLSTAGEVLTVESDNANWLVTSHIANSVPVSYSPSLSSPFGTVTSSSWFWQRLGNLMIVWGSFTAGTTAANISAIPLPGGNIDTTTLARGNTTGSAGHIIGTYAQNSAAQNALIVTATGTSTSNVYVGGLLSGSAQQTPANGSAVCVTGGIVSIYFQVPISTWQP